MVRRKKRRSPDAPMRNMAKNLNAAGGALIPEPTAGQSLHRPARENRKISKNRVGAPPSTDPPAQVLRNLSEKH